MKIPYYINYEAPPKSKYSRKHLVILSTTVLLSSLATTLLSVHFLVYRINPEGISLNFVLPTFIFPYYFIYMFFAGGNGSPTICWTLLLSELPIYGLLLTHGMNKGLVSKIGRVMIVIHLIAAISAYAMLIG